MSGLNEAATTSLGQATASACPLVDRRPVPRGSAADGPVGFGEQAALSPDVGGVALHAEPVGDLDESHGVTVVHTDDCTKSLDICLACSDNQYMTNTELRTFTIENYGVDLDELSTDAENVIRRSFESGQVAKLDLFTDITGIVHIRWAA